MAKSRSGMFIHLFAVLSLVEVLPMVAEAKNRCKGETKADWIKELKKLGKTDYGWKMKALRAFNQHFKEIPKQLKYCPEEERKADDCAKANIDNNMTFVNPQCRPFLYRPKEPKTIIYEGDKIKHEDIANLLGQEYIKFCYEEIPTHVACAKRSNPNHRVFSCIFLNEYGRISMLQFKSYYTYYYCPKFYIESGRD